MNEVVQDLAFELSLSHKQQIARLGIATLVGFIASKGAEKAFNAAVVAIRQKRAS